MKNLIIIYLIALINVTSFADHKNIQSVTLKQNSVLFQKINNSFSDESAAKNIDADLSSDQAYQEMSNRFSDVMNAYIDGAGAEDIFEYIQKRPNIANPIMRYIDPQEELEEPIWRTVNRKLRNSLVLNDDENQFKNDLDAALLQLPAVEGITFRGASLKDKNLNQYTLGAIIEEKGFSSTSLDFSIAQGFASPQENRWSVIFIIKGKTGRLISLFVPSNMHEGEILFKTSTRFEVNRVIKNTLKSTAIVWMSEI